MEDSLQLGDLLSLGFDLLGHLAVADDGGDELEETGAGARLLRHLGDRDVHLFEEAFRR